MSTIPLPEEGHSTPKQESFVCDGVTDNLGALSWSLAQGLQQGAGAGVANARCPDGLDG